jgi:hypothetical protein
VLVIGDDLVQRADDVHVQPAETARSWYAAVVVVVWGVALGRGRAAPRSGPGVVEA